MTILRQFQLYHSLLGKKALFNLKQIKWFLLLALFAVAFGIYDAIRENEENKKYFRDLNLMLKGVVESVDLSYIPNGFGVVKVSIIESNKNFYDPRKDRKYYYCIIKDNQAEFYQYGLYDCKVGDTIEVNTRKRIFIIKNGAKSDIE